MGEGGGCRFHIRLGCKEVLYDTDEQSGETRVTGLLMNKVGGEGYQKRGREISAKEGRISEERGWTSEEGGRISEERGWNKCREGCGY